MRVLALFTLATATNGFQLSLAPPRRMLTTLSAESCVTRRSILGTALVGVATASPAWADDEPEVAPPAPPPALPSEGEPVATAAPPETPEPPARVYVKVVGEDTAVSKTKV